MLERLEIENFILIDRMAIAFASGFNAITGESGSGKSMILKALSFLTSRGVSPLPLDPGRPVEVTAVFSMEGASDGHLLDGARFGGMCSSKCGMEGDGSDGVDCAEADSSEYSDIRGFLAANGIVADDGLLFFRRTARPGGRTMSFIQGKSLPSSLFEEACGFLIRLNSKMDEYRLFSPEKSRSFIDENAGISAESRRAAKLRLERRRIKFELSDFDERLSRILKDRDYMEFALREIRDAGLAEDEDDELKARIRNCEQYVAAIAAAESVETLFPHRENW